MVENDSRPEVRSNEVVFDSLRKQSEFDAVFRSGVRTKRGGLVVVGIHDDDEISKRRVVSIGFKIGRRIGTAVIRNRLRRRLKDILRRMSRHVVGRWRLVVIATASVTNASYRELERNLWEAIGDIQRRRR